MYCRLCQKFDKRPFGRDTWNREPSVRFRLQSVKAHEQTVAHKDAIRMEAECKTTSDIAVVIHPEASLSEMSQVFAALYFLCKQRIAHTTNFEPILDLLGFLGNELKSKIRCGKNATYCSVKSIQENLQCMSEIIENDIIDKLRQSKHFSLLFDETTDCAVIEQMVIRGRFIDSDGTLHVKFLKVLDALKPEVEGDNTDDGIISLNAQNISQRVKKFIENKELDYACLRGLGTDGAAVMTGRVNGAVKRIQNAQLAAQIGPVESKCEAIGSHCAAHKLNLAVSQAGDHIPYVKKFKAILRQLYDFYNNSAVRSAGLVAV